jgi:hypothetical protein
MGADIWLWNGKRGRARYFRDSYNETCLAWVIDLSYQEDFEKNPTRFMKKLASITDEQIENYVQNMHGLLLLFGDLDEKRKKRKLVRILKSKRDELKEWFEKYPKGKVVAYWI